MERDRERQRHRLRKTQTERHIETKEMKSRNTSLISFYFKS